MIKKLIASVLATSVILSSSVFAMEEINEEYDFFATLMTYASQLYIDENVTSEKILF